MKMCSVLMTGVALSAAAALALAQPEKKPTTPAKPSATQPTQPAKPGETPGQPSQAEIDAWMKAGTPGENHKLIEQFAGNWNAKVTSQMDPAAPAETSEGTMTSAWVLDGRWLKQDFSGTFMGGPFTGIGYFGYDNIKKEFVSTWMDSMSTSMMISTGQVDAGKKAFTLNGECTDPVTGKTQNSRMVIKVVDANKHVMEMYGPDKTGKEFKMMTIEYTKAGASPRPDAPKPGGGR